MDNPSSGIKRELPPMVNVEVRGVQTKEIAKILSRLDELDPDQIAMGAAYLKENKPGFDIRTLLAKLEKITSDPLTVEEGA